MGYLARLTFWALDLGPAAGSPTRPGSRWGAPAPAPAACDAVEELRPELEAELAAAMGLPLAVVGARLRRARCFVLRCDGRIATYGWMSVAPTPVGEIGAAFHPAPGEAYVWDCATLPAYRGRGLYTRFLRGLAATLADEGYRRLSIGVLDQNEPARRAASRAGFRPALRVRSLRLLGQRWCWARPAQGAPPALADALRRALRLPAPRGQRPAREPGAPPTPLHRPDTA